MMKNNFELRKKIEMILRQNLIKLEQNSAFVTDITDEIVLYLFENYDMNKK